MIISITLTGAMYLFTKYPEIKGYYIARIFLIYLTLYVIALFYCQGFEHALSKENNAVYDILKETKHSEKIESTGQTQVILNKLDEDRKETVFIIKCLDTYGLIVYVILGLLVFATNEYKKFNTVSRNEIKDKFK